MTSPTMSDNIDPEVIEQSLRLAAANQAVEDASRDGYTKLRSGLYLNSQESITAEQEDWIQEGGPVYDYSQAPYWMTTDDGQSPTPIHDADDLLDFVDIDDQLEEVMAAADRRASLSRWLEINDLGAFLHELEAAIRLAVAEQRREALSEVSKASRPVNNLASPDEYMARRNRGRAM